MKNTILSIASAVVFSTVTFAQANDTKHFSGGFAGVEAGYFDENDGYNGFYYGANIGYRGQSVSGLVYGIEGTIGRTSLDVDDSNNDAEHEYIFTVMPTIGWAFGADKRNLFSLGAGYARVKTTWSGTGHAPLENWSFSATGNGIAGFIGYERALGSTASLRFRVKTYEFNGYQGTVGVGVRF